MGEKNKFVNVCKKQPTLNRSFYKITRKIIKKKFGSRIVWQYAKDCQVRSAKMHKNKNGKRNYLKRNYLYKLREEKKCKRKNKNNN